tara:strand:+ start:10852 stop:11190 length:339 start_codon:yes stop_codon:yes gene_type:complete
MERLGREPDPSKAPLEPHHFPAEVQIAFFIHTLLPDRWDGASGTYLGKDWSALGTLLKVHKIENPSIITIFLKQIDVFNQKSVNDKLEKERKKEERRTSGSMTNLPKVPRKR